MQQHERACHSTICMFLGYRIVCGGKFKIVERTRAVHVRPQHYACDQTASLGLLVGLTKWEVLGSVSEIVGLMPSDNAVGGAEGYGQEGRLSEAI